MKHAGVELKELGLAYERARWISKFIRRKPEEKQESILADKKKEWGKDFYDLVLKIEKKLSPIVRDLGYRLSLYRVNSIEYKELAGKFLKEIA